jgi:hypothetical protein
MRAFGPLALGLLAFYAIFWVAAAALARAALRMLGREELRLEGRELFLRRVTALGAWEETFTLAPESRAYLAETTRQQGRGIAEVAIQDAAGRDVRFAAGRPLVEQERLAERINEYLAALNRAGE